MTLIDDDLIIFSNTRISADFVDGFLPQDFKLAIFDEELSPTLPTMLTSDALPLGPLDFDFVDFDMLLSNGSLVTVSLVPIPEPGTAVLLFIGLMGLAKKRPL